MRTAWLGETDQSFGIKAPGDRLDYCFECPIDVDDGEIILQVTSLTASPPGLMLTVFSAAFGSIRFWAESGVAQQSYAIKCTAVTSRGLQLAGAAGLYTGSPGLDDPSPVAPSA